MAGDKPTVDLHDLAVLANYERIAAEPKFQRAKLREVAIRHDGALAFAGPYRIGPLRTVVRPGVPCRAFIWEQKPRAPLPDRLSSMIAADAHGSAYQLSEDERETIWYEARNHSGGYKSIKLLQQCFDLMSDSMPLRIRTAKGEEFTCTIADRVVLEYEVAGARTQHVSIVFPDGHAHFMGTTTDPYPFLGFAEPGSKFVTHVLDCATMMQGPTGWGAGGETFHLSSKADFDAWIEQRYDEVRIMAGKELGGSMFVRRGPDDDWLYSVAERVYERWTKRETEPWCARCGEPALAKRCPCREAAYCSERCQKKAWRFHRQFCSLRRA